MSEELIEEVITDAEAEGISEAEQRRADSKYRVIIVAARRSKQLQRGAKPRVEMDPKHKMTRVALAEVRAGKVNYKVLEDK